MMKTTRQDFCFGGQRHGLVVRLERPAHNAEQDQEALGCDRRVSESPWNIRRIHVLRSESVRLQDFGAIGELLEMLGSNVEVEMDVETVKRSRYCVLFSDFSRFLFCCYTLT